LPQLRQSFPLGRVNQGISEVVERDKRRTMVYGMYSQILVPLDGSDLAEQAIPQAEGLARSFHATLHLVQVFSVPRELVSVLEVGIGMPSPLDPNLSLAHLVVEAGRAKSQAYLERLAAQLRDNGIKVETEVLEGIADEEILAYAKEHDVDCIVVTTQGLSGLRQFLLGSVTDRLIRSSEVPVVVVPSRLKSPSG
jgi:nucleotide-binding universal stress UspA family protein